MLLKEKLLIGLSKEEVLDRIAAGQVNKTDNKKTKSYLEIFVKNICTFFNLLIAVMAVAVFFTLESFSQIGNIMFVFVALANLIIGIVQEIKAKKTIEKLMLVTEPTARVYRDFDYFDISIQEIVLDDTVFLEAGKQIVADSKVVEGEVYVNESNITGEADAICKTVGDKLYSGSFVVSGTCHCKVTAVGKDNYVEKLASEVSKYTKPKSEIIHSLNVLIKIISILIIPILIALIYILPKYTNFDFAENLSKTILQIVQSINGMIPAGLFLLTTIALASSVIKLGKSNTVVQELNCIESLARVDVLCLDKTGTITDGTMHVTEVIPLDIDDKFKNVSDIISSMNYALKDNNQTSVALREKFGSKRKFRAQRTLNFNSMNKYSAVSFADMGTFVLGAPEFIIKATKNSRILKKVNDRAKNGERVLALCQTKEPILAERVSGSFIPIALICIMDNIRQGAKETLAQFEANGVEIKVISGDNPITVSSIARAAGVKNYDKYISLDGMTDEDIERIATEYTIFGRVKPEQKRTLVQSLKKAGHKVAMTGDGVNDILALKEADCSIAMASGSDAATSISHLVLLDSNFLSLPKIVGEGRRVINNVQRGATLFIVKTIFMFLVNVAVILLFFLAPDLEFVSPFKEPRQLLIIETFIIGIPSTILALESNNSIIKGKFLRNVILQALPGAILVLFDMSITYLFKSLFQGVTSEHVSTIAVISSTFTYLMVLYSICTPPSRLRTGVCLFSSLVMIIAIVFLPNIFGLTVVTFNPLELLLSKEAILLLIALMEFSYIVMSFYKKTLLKLW